MYINILFLLGALFLASSYAQVCIPPTITQARREHTWTDNTGKSFSVWDVSITARNETVVNIAVSFELPAGAQLVDLWELSPSSLKNAGIADLYGFPAWRSPNPNIPNDEGGLPAYTTHTFGYIISSLSPATVNLANVLCSGLVGIYPQAILCDSTYYTECATLVSARGTGYENCYNFDHFFPSKLSSFLFFGVEGAERVRVYSQAGCSGDVYSVAPGNYNLGGTAFDNVGASLQFVPLRLAELNLCNDQSGEGCYTVNPTNGLDACYNLVPANNNAVSSVQLFSHDTPVRAIQFFDDANCGGATWTLDFPNGAGYFGYVGDEYDNRATSIKFIAA